jgi:antitoxin YefM
MVTTTYTNVRANLTRYLDQVTDNRETVVIQRRGHEDVIMISADELNSLLETCPRPFRISAIS